MRGGATNSGVADALDTATVQASDTPNIFITRFAPATVSFIDAGAFCAYAGHTFLSS